MYEKHIQKAQELTKDHGILIYLSLSGSLLHGTNNENSDLDLKGIYIPNLSQLIKKDVPVISWNSNRDQKNSNKDVDIEIIPINKFLHNLSKGEMTSVDTYFAMFAPFAILYEKTEYIDILKNNKENLISGNYNSFFGFAYSQLERYRNAGERFNSIKKLLNALPDTNTLLSEIDVPSLKGIKKKDGFLMVFNKDYQLNLKTNKVKKQIQKTLEEYGERVAQTAEDGDSFKALSHSVRALLEAKELQDTKHLIFPLNYAKLLKDIKEGRIDRKEVEALIEELKQDFSSFKKKVNPHEISEKIISKYLKTIYCTGEQ